MARYATLDIYGSIFGKDVKVTTIRGSLEHLVDEVKEMVPTVGIMDTLNAIKNAVWEDEGKITWIGSHMLGIVVVSIDSE